MHFRYTVDAFNQIVRPEAAKKKQLILAPQDQKTKRITVFAGNSTVNMR